jgi:hypothetical protein
MHNSNEKIRELAIRAYDEFSDIADFIWKSPRLIDIEMKLERRKLDKYFPLKGIAEEDDLSNRLRKTRWHHEKHKLRAVFPSLIANGNLFTCISVFETYCLMLARTLEEHTTLSLSKGSGIGISKCFRFFDRASIPRDKLVYREQVRSALLIRNCLVHASGLLEWSRDSMELIGLIKEHLYMPPYARDKISKKKLGGVTIVERTLGHQLQISNDYAHDVAYYLQCHFIDLCKGTQVVLHGEITIRLPVPSFYKLEAQ